MTAKELAALVLRVLAAQQSIFKTRHRDDLVASKKREGELKRAAEGIVNDTLVQAGLLEPGEVAP